VGDHVRATDWLYSAGESSDSWVDAEAIARRSQRSHV